MGIFSKWSILEKVEHKLEMEILHNPTFPFTRNEADHVLEYKDKSPDFYISSYPQLRSSVKESSSLWHSSSTSLVPSGYEVGELANKRFFASLCVRHNLVSARFVREATPLTDRVGPRFTEIPRERVLSGKSGSTFTPSTLKRFDNFLYLLTNSPYFSSSTSLLDETHIGTPNDNGGSSELPTISLPSLPVIRLRKNVLNQSFTSHYCYRVDGGKTNHF
eukprot:sb/3469872/